MPLVISIPNQCSTNAPRKFLENDFFGFTEDKTAFIKFHPAFVYLQPFAISMLAAWADYCNQVGVRVETENIKASGVEYLWRMGLLKYVQPDYKSTRTEHEPSGRFIPLTKVATSEDLRKFISDLVPLLHLDSVDKANAVRYCISEMTRNVLEHAGGNCSAFVSAQFFKDAQRVSIGVADTGVGILSTLKGKYGVADDGTAIIEAMKPGISGTSANMYGSKDNAGAGLFFTKSIADFTGEYFVLLSGNTYYRLMRRRIGEKIRLSFDPLQNRSQVCPIKGWNGTAVAIDINISRVGNFNDIVSLIRDAFFESRKAKPSFAAKVKFT